MRARVAIGIAGCGTIAMQKHLPALRKLERVSIKGFYDRNRHKAEHARDLYGAEDARVYESFEDMIRDDDLHAIHVCTNNQSHAEMSIRALEAGKHVMCEKPMARTAEEARAMLAAARKSGRKLSVSYQNRFRPEVRYLRDLCRKGELGEIYYAKAHAVRRRAVPTWGTFLNREVQGGGPLIDIGSHALDLALWLTDNYKPKSVMGNAYAKIGPLGSLANAWGPWDPGKFTVEDAAFAFITMENGATIYLEASWALNTLEEGEAMVTLCGTKAGADMRGGLRIHGEREGRLYTTLIETDVHNNRPFIRSESAAELEARSWIDSLIGDENSDLVVKPEQALVVTEIIEAIYESSRTGKPVFFS